MKLYYSPSLADIPSLPEIPLYTQSVVDQLSEVERQYIRELDEEGIALIGDRPCRIQTQETSPEEREQRVNELMHITKENLKKLGIRDRGFIL